MNSKKGICWAVLFLVGCFFERVNSTPVQAVCFLDLPSDNLTAVADFLDIRSKVNFLNSSLALASARAELSDDPIILAQKTKYREEEEKQARVNFRYSLSTYNLNHFDQRIKGEVYQGWQASIPKSSLDSRVSSWFKQRSHKKSFQLAKDLLLESYGLKEVSSIRSLMGKIPSLSKVKQPQKIQLFTNAIRRLTDLGYFTLPMPYGNPGEKQFYQKTLVENIDRAIRLKKRLRKKELFQVKSKSYYTWQGVYIDTLY